GSRRRRARPRHPTDRPRIRRCAGRPRRGAPAADEPADRDRSACGRRPARGPGTGPWHGSRAAESNPAAGCRADHGRRPAPLRSGRPVAGQPGNRLGRGQPGRGTLPRTAVAGNPDAPRSKPNHRAGHLMAHSAILLLALAILAHLIADFILQTDVIAEAKGAPDGRAWRGLGVHPGMVAVCLLPFVAAYGPRGLGYLIVVAVAHGLIDRTKVILNRRAG